MTEHMGESGKGAVDVHNRLDVVVLSVTDHDNGCAGTTLTPAGARRLAQLLIDAADKAEQTPGS